MSLSQGMGEGIRRGREGHKGKDNRAVGCGLRGLTWAGSYSSCPRADQSFLSAADVPVVTGDVWCDRCELDVEVRRVRRSGFETG